MRRPGVETRGRVGGDLEDALFQLDRGQLEFVERTASYLHLATTKDGALSEFFGRLQDAACHAHGLEAYAIAHAEREMGDTRG